MAGYLFVCFAVLMFYESTLSGAVRSRRILSLGAAAIKAAILAKFLLLGQALGVGEKRASQAGGSIFAKSVQLWLLVIVLSVVEELLVGRYHGNSFGATLAEYRKKPIVPLWPRVWWCC